MLNLPIERAPIITESNSSNNNNNKQFGSSYIRACRYCNKNEWPHDSKEKIAAATTKDTFVSLLLLQFLTAFCVVYIHYKPHLLWLRLPKRLRFFSTLKRYWPQSTSRSALQVPNANGPFLGRARGRGVRDGTLKSHCNKI